MSLTGKEVAQMHKDYVMQSWARSGADTLPVERAEGIDRKSTRLNSSHPK